MAARIDDIRRDREKFVAFAFAAAEIFIELDDAGTVTFEGGAIDRLAGGQSLIGKPFRDIILEDDRIILDALMTHLSQKGRIGPMPMRLCLDDGDDVALKTFALRMPDNNQRTYLAMRAAGLSGHDGNDDRINPETGLLNADEFMATAAKTMSGDDSAALLMTVTEVDGLEQASTTLGKTKAKKLLRAIAAHLRMLSVEGWTAGQLDTKHFAFVHKGASDANALMRSVQSLGKDIDLSAKSLTVAGVKTLDEESVLKTLSYVLDQFITDPENCNFDSLSEGYEDMVKAAQSRQTKLQTVIECGSFDFAYQPIKSLADYSTKHFEVLSRFDSSFVGDSPGDVIRFAEEIGMIEAYDKAALTKAIGIASKMRGLGTPMSLSVNVSGRSLASDSHRDALWTLLKNNQSVASKMILELTETHKIEDIQAAANCLKNIKELGCRLSLDDFGSGAAGYEYLKAFNVDFIKIDGSYVRDIGKADFRPTFLMSIVRLCADLGVKSIGAQIENRFEADFLKSLGVDMGQGYYFGKPSFTPILDH